MDTDWAAIDDLWDGFTSQYEPVFAQQGLRARPHASIAEDWDSVDTFWEQYVTQHTAALTSLAETMTAVQNHWQRSDTPFDDDPLSADWRSASHAQGPLRSTIDEEDWSQWLAHLLRTSSGPFVAALLGLPEQSPETVRREVVVSDADSTRRIDILVEHPTVGVSIEVKNGDTHYRKTPETAALVEQQDQREWTHVLLMQRSNRHQLDGTFGADLRSDEKHRPTIHEQAHPPVTVTYWEAVSRTLRRMLTDGSEPNSHWQASAYLFITLIEQRILGLLSVDHIEAAATASETTTAGQLQQVMTGDPDRQQQYFERLLSKET